MPHKVSVSNQNSSWFPELFRTILLSIFLALGIRTFVAEARWIPTDSMKPTLKGYKDQLKADKIIVDKLGYNFSVPQRGDIVVFSATEKLKEEGFTDAFVKRVIALPGEQVELRNDKVFIDGKQLLETKYLTAEQKTSLGVCASGLQTPFLSQSVKIPSEHYLVLGDNRIDSYDGRCWGLVPRANIIGRAVIRFWPPQKIGRIDKEPVYYETN
ncbi:signal peptidase I [Calothrix sp. PCC 6303]|uniref:signal peptidase I n=1 Tax=Calothrix sp. PCC 6303 TaxID=1170562 RepID=UPI0002A01917|nr:signal peptidase I [Calothrix sp. PCC 6303]AFZ03844.1 signal peptidase I [Calothrix sp. PCC 6303]